MTNSNDNNAGLLDDLLSRERLKAMTPAELKDLVHRLRKAVDVVGRAIDATSDRLDAGIRRRVYADIGSLLARRFAGDPADFAAWAYATAEPTAVRSVDEQAQAARVAHLVPETVVLRCCYEKHTSGPGTQYVVVAQVYLKRSDGNIDKLESERVVGIDEMPDEVQTAFLSGSKTLCEFKLS